MQTGPGGDINLQEQINKFAESEFKGLNSPRVLNAVCSAGKRTFNTIFTKVKEKLKEFEQPPK